MASTSLLANGTARWAGLEKFFAMRAIPGLESVTEHGFRRNMPGGWVELLGHPADTELRVRYQLDDPDRVPELLATVRQVTDLDTDLAPIEADLAADPVLARRLAQRPLGRRPGAFDRFEVAVRAVVGQQVSVAGARTLLGRLVAEAASVADAMTSTAEPLTGSSRFDRFPPPELIAEAPLELGMPKRRRDTIRALATAVADRRVTLDPAAGTDTVTEQLLAIAGIGPWTAGYVAMRCLDDPDAWPVGDLGLRRSLGTDAAELERRAERWRPWRAYAALLLWQTDPTATGTKSEDRT